MGSHLKSRKKQDNNPSKENNGNNDKSDDNKNENNSERNNNINNEDIKDKEKEPNSDNSDKNNNTKDNDNNKDYDSDECEDNNIKMIKEVIKRNKEMMNDVKHPEKEYENFCKELIFIKDNKVTVKVNQKFAEEARRNYTITPEYWRDYPTEN